MLYLSLSVNFLIRLGTSWHRLHITLPSINHTVTQSKRLHSTKYQHRVTNLLSSISSVAAALAFVSVHKTYKAIISVFANPVNPQRDCPLFNKIPREIRDSIFDLVMAPLEDEEEDDEDSRDYGPDYPEGIFSAALLRCCQLIYFEARNLIPKKYVQFHIYSGKCEAYSSADVEGFEIYYPSVIRNLYIYFTPGRRSILPEDISWWRNFIRLTGIHTPDLRCLKLIVPRYFLWAFTKVVANPYKTHGTLKDMEDSDFFHEGPWIHQLQALERLVVMEWELQTLEKDKVVLDLMVEKAAGWRFPLTKGKELVLKSQKTRWMWWRQPIFGEPTLSIIPSIDALSSSNR